MYGLSLDISYKSAVMRTPSCDGKVIVLNAGLADSVIKPESPGLSKVLFNEIVAQQKIANKLIIVIEFFICLLLEPITCKLKIYT